MKDPSEKVQIAAVKENGWAIQYIDHPSLEVQLHAVMSSGRAIQFIKDPSPEVQVLAVCNTPVAICYIAHPTDKAAYYALLHAEPADIHMIVEHIKETIDMNRLSNDLKLLLLIV